MSGPFIDDISIFRLPLILIMTHNVDINKWEDPKLPIYTIWILVTYASFNGLE